MFAFRKLRSNIISSSFVLLVTIILEFMLVHFCIVFFFEAYKVTVDILFVVSMLALNLIAFQLVLNIRTFKKDL